MEIGQALLFAFLVWVGWKMLKGFDKGHTQVMHCTTCGHEGETKTQTRGSLGIEIVLWLCFLIPGLIYSLWRHGSRRAICASCGATTLVPTTSPVAVAARKALGGQ